MFKKNLLLMISMSLVLAGASHCFGSYANAASDQSQGVPKQIESLQKQIDELKKQIENLQSGSPGQVLKIIRVEKTVDFLNEGAAEPSVSCPEGTLLTGGGFSGDNGDVYGWKSKPVSSNRWEAGGVDKLGGGNAHSVTAFAICASLEPK
jgi:hypothetical protein